MTRKEDNYKNLKQEKKCDQKQRAFRHIDPQRSQTKKDINFLQLRKKSDKEHID